MIVIKICQAWRCIMLGRLTLDAFKHDQIVMFGVISMIGAGLLAVILLTVFKKWKWLYKEWLTTLDPKKIGKPKN